MFHFNLYYFGILTMNCIFAKIGPQFTQSAESANAIVLGLTHLHFLKYAKQVTAAEGQNQGNTVHGTFRCRTNSYISPPPTKTENVLMDRVEPGNISYSEVNINSSQKAK